MARNNIPPDGRTSSPPEVARPTGVTWEDLAAEGVAHESQVLIVGLGTDLPARLILTRERLVLVADGEIAIEVPRAWLRPAPKLAAENGVRIYVTPTGPGISGDTETLSIRARGGRGAALELIGAVAGRALPKLDRPSRPSLPAIPTEAPPQSSSAGASRVLPPLPDFAQIMEATVPKGSGDKSWPPVETGGIHAPVATPSVSRPTSPASSTEAMTERVQKAPAGWTLPVPGNAPQPAPVPSTVSRAARKQGTLADGETVSDVAYVPDVATAQSFRRRTAVWSLRLAILLIIVGTGTYLGRDYLRDQARDMNLPLPNRVERELGITNGTKIASNPNDQVSQLAAGDGNHPTIPATKGDNVLENVGGTTGPIPTASVEPTSTETSSVQNAAAPTDAPTDIPTVEPTQVPPTDEPTLVPTDVPTEPPTEVPPTVVPTDVPPTEAPTLSPTDVPTQEPTATTTTTTAPTRTPEPTLAPTEKPTNAPAVVPTIAPATPTAEPTRTPEPSLSATNTPKPTTPPTNTPAPTATATATNTPVPTTTPEPTATATATPMPTITPARTDTFVPTTGPTRTNTPAPTKTAAPTVTPAPAPTDTATVAPTPTLVPQQPSVDPKATPDQQIASGGFRYSIDGASYGASVPDLPDIATIDYGDWLVLTVTGQNVTGSDQVFDMSTFKLLADGQEVNVDVGNAWIAGMLGYTPAYGNVDQFTWAAGESHQFALTFLAPVGAQSLVLEAGDQQIDLTPSITSRSSLETAKTKPDAVVPTTIEAKVVKVVNAETILVDINGRQQEVRYLGVDAPSGSDCYAKEATAANSALVEGQTVRIERQATDVDARGNWVRDVWAPDANGAYQLVANSLIAKGAAKADISEPNTRFDGWLTASQNAAQSQGLGLWGSCSNETPDSTVPPVPTPAASLNGDTTAFRIDDRHA